MRRYAHLSILPLSIHAPRRGSDCTRAMSPVFWNTRQEWTIFSNASSLLDCGLTKSRHPLFSSYFIPFFYFSQSACMRKPAILHAILGR